MKDKALTVSIVIPAYNEENQIEACLDALAAQTVKPLEVIVVDNNSTDKTATLARGYPFVRVLQEKQQGIVFARNRGFNAAKGNIIGRIDVDSRLPVDWVAQITDFYRFSAHRDYAITGGCTFYNVRLPRVDHWVTSQFVFRMNRLLVGHYILWGSNMALSRDAWQAVKGATCTRTDIHEDLDLSMHLHRRHFPIHYQSNLQVGARMPHVFDKGDGLWPYLKMWPRTLRVHGFKNWPGSYIGAAFLYVMQVVPRGLERIAVMAGRPPLN